MFLASIFMHYSPRSFILRDFKLDQSKQERAELQWVVPVFQSADSVFFLFLFFFFLV